VIDAFAWLNPYQNRFILGNQGGGSAPRGYDQATNVFALSV
jgi:hypothetical protein